MICMVYRLRQHGIRLREGGDGLYMRGWVGALVYDVNKRGEMCAQLFDLETSEEKMRMERARVVKARDGGLLISGEEMHYRAVKDKGTGYRQTWWCMPVTKVATAPRIVQA